MKKAFWSFLSAVMMTAPLAAATYERPLLLSSRYPNANTYYIAYFDFLSQTAQSVPNNSYLEYDVFLALDSADYSGGVDFRGVGWSNLRDFTSGSGSYIRDQNYLRAHPFSDISPYAKGKWYHRKFDMGAAAGRSFAEVCLTNDTGNNSNGAPANQAGWYNGYFTNIKFTNAYGATLLDLFSNANSLSLPGSPVSSSTPFGGAGAATALDNSVSVTQSLSVVGSGSPALADGSTAVTVTATFSGPGGVPVPGARVSLQASRSADTLSPTTGITDSLGRVTATVVSSLAGSSAIVAEAGPFSASTSIAFSAGPASAWRLDVPIQTFVVGPSATTLTVAAMDAFGNVTGTGRSVVLSSSDNLIQLSTDNVSFSSAGAGITLTPATGPLSFYIRISGGPYRNAVLNAVDSLPAGALVADDDTIVINPSTANAASLHLPSNGTAGAALVLSGTALDGAGRPASSVASFTLTAPRASAAFSQDNGFSWASTTTVAMSSGGFSLLFRDTLAGSSGVSATSSLGNPSASTLIVAGAAALVSGSASPSAVFNNIVNGPNYTTLTAWVVDEWLNPVAGANVTFTVVAGGGSLAAATVATDSQGRARVVYTVGATASNSNYIRASVNGLKPTMINVTASNPSRLNLSPNPATTGVDVPTEFIVLAQDASNPAITGSSSSTVRLSSTTATMDFSANGVSGWGSSLDIALSSGQGRFFARNSSPTGAAGSTITANDLRTSLATGVANLYIFQASLQVYQLSSQQFNVSQGESGVSVTMTVRNQGGTNATLNPSSAVTRPTFNGLVTGYTITPSPSNPTLVPAGGSVQLQFNIGVSAGALGSVTINGQVSGQDAETLATLNDNGSSALSDLWVVAGPATQLRVYHNAAGTPVAGAPFSVSVVALDASNNTVSTFSQPLSVSARLNASPGVTASGQVALQWPVFSQGVAGFSASYNKVEGVHLHALAGGLFAVSTGITPVPDVLERYRVYNPPSVLLGAPFAVTISAMDQWGNTRSAAAAVTLTPDGGSGTLAVGWKDLSSGLAAFFDEAYNLAEVIRIRVSDGAVLSVLAETTPISIITYTATVTATATPSASPTASPTASETGTPTATGTDTLTATGTASPTATGTASPTPTATPSPTPTATASATPTETATSSLTATESSTPTSTETATPTASGTATATVTGTATPSASGTATATVTETATLTTTETGTATATQSDTPTATPSATPSATPTATGTATPTATATASPSQTPTQTPTATGSSTATETATPTATSTASPSASPSATPSATGTVTPTASPSATPTATPSASPSATGTATPTATPSITGTATPTGSPSASPTATPSATPTATPTASPTASPSSTVTPTDSPTATPTDTSTASPTRTATPLDTATATPSQTPSFTHSPTLSPTPSSTPTPAFAASGLGRDIFAPNPVRAGDVVRLFFKVRPRASEVVIFSLAGEVVARWQGGPGEQPVWDPKGMASGIYIAWAEITDEDGTIHRFKQKLALVF